MGPLAMTGLVLLGAAIGLGLLASRSRPVSVRTDAPRIRAILTIAAAFIQSIGVLAVVVGLLAVELGAAAGQNSALLVAGLAVAGALLGIGVIARHAGRVDPQAALLGAMFAIGLGTLGAVTGIFAIVLDERGSDVPPDWPFVAIGVISGACALGIGWIGGRALTAATVADADLAAIRTGMLRRIVPLVIVGVVAMGVAMLMLVVG
jgi:F0F1-type ATP synthase membrane subunit c/vacuolar-type H+-ATPase subunit K